MQFWQEHPSSPLRTYHDPLHGAIALNRQDPVEALLIQLIDTPAFQRLRRIRQLGPASLTFHGAEASRFTHSLGVLAIARRAFDGITPRFPLLAPHRSTVLCAALLHDLGHGPFSHTSEEVFGIHHEIWTQRILRESAPVRQYLDAFDPQLVDRIIQVYTHSHPIPLLGQLVSSQLDCDRLDYLMRDSYFTGASYGRLDLDRILLALTYDPKSQELVVRAKGIAAIEHYLIVRHFMYAQVYNHPKNLAATLVLDRAIQRARELLAIGQLPSDDTMRAWLHGSLTLENYLHADDNLFFYHLNLWKRHGDRVLADLCRRFLDRDLLKAIDITPLSSSQHPSLLEQLHPALIQAGFEPHYYLGIRTTLSRGYTLYQRGIKLQTDRGLEELSDRSPLVKTLIQSTQRTWLLYPREVDPLPYLQSLTPST